MPPRRAKRQASVATGSDGKAVAGPLLIYKAQLSLAVFEAKKSIDAVEKLAKENGGYLVSREGHPHHHPGARGKVRRRARPDRQDGRPLASQRERARRGGQLHPISRSACATWK